jgi:hypothetical protein
MTMICFEVNLKCNSSIPMLNIELYFNRTAKNSLFTNYKNILN